MDKKRIALLGVVVLFILMVGFFLWQQSQNKSETLVPTPSPTVAIDPSITSTPAEMEEDENANIRVSLPKSNDVVRLPIAISGEARVFENQLNYRVRDTDGTILMEGLALANSPDTGQYGPFNIIIDSLPNPLAKTLTLEVFDYSAKDGTEIDTVRVPVHLDIEGTMLVKVFFGSNKAAPEGEECTAIYSASRRVMRTQGIARAALEELLKGPMIIEESNGYLTSINEGVKIQSLTISNGVARADFDKTLEEAVGGSCRVTAIRAQITQTLKQFSTVKDVVISIDGRTEDILQP
ncbi:MAG: Gmad2 immunoglobulin-like domain-containing protein [Candidatus Levybacteria bacterium]|nr:Gmad2 immunoglobulin-like domain-containing protein [Candidatus Levybacteria bacterium]